MYSRTKSASRAFARLLACALCLAVWPTTVQAADKSQQAYWAGFAYTADAAAVQATTPHAHAVLERRGLVPLNQTLAQSLKRRAPAHLELIDQPVAMLDGTTSATVLAAALDRELVSVEPIGDQYKVLVEVALQALFFDFRERQVIASYPLTLQRIDVQDYRPDNDDIDAIVADLLYGGADTSLSQVLAASLAQARLPDAAVRRLQVGGVTLSDAVRAKLPDPKWEAPLRATLAHELSKTLSSNTGVGLLPPASGQAIGGAMAARFADGKVYQLKIPEPDYVINLQVDALKNGVIEETPAMKTMLFGAFFTAKVTEPFSGKVYFEQPLRKGPPRWFRPRSGRSTSGRPATKPCWPGSMPSPAPPPSVPIRAPGWTNRSRAVPVAAADPSPPGVDQVMSLMRTILLILIALVVASPVAAQTASSRGTGSASYGLRLSADTRAQALNKAKVNALEAYIAETGAAKLRLFEARRAEFIGEIDRYVLSAVQLSDTEDKKAKTYTVTVRAEINTTLLQTKLDAGSVAGATAAQRSLLTFLFMARSQDTVQSFHDKEYRRVDASSSYSENTREGDSFRGNSVSTNGSINQNGSVSVTSGGSTTARADNITWKVANAAEVNTAMTGAFSAAGYEVVESEYVEGESRGLLSIERIRKDFSTGNDLAPATLRDTANGIRAANIPYIAVGTLDVGMRDRDPASGNTRVFVTVTGKVLDVTGRFPRTVSSVGPVQFSGTGPNETVARTNALQLAAEKAAQQMINELNVKAVR